MEYIKKTFEAGRQAVNAWYDKYYWWIKVLLMSSYIISGIITFWFLIIIFN